MKGVNMSNPRELLFIDHDAAHARAFKQVVDSKNNLFKAEYVSTLENALVHLKNNGTWAIFLNLSLPDSKGIETFDKLQKAASSIPILVVAGAGEEEIGTEALRRGAKDFLLEDRIDAYSLERALRNMMEREKAEEGIFAEKERAQVTLNSIGDAVLCTDIEGNVTYLNVVAEQMTGWSHGDASGKPLAEVFNIVDGVTRKTSPNPMKMAMRTNKTVELSANCVLIRRDGIEIPIEDSAAPIHDRLGQIAGAVIVFHDVKMSKAITEEMVHLAQYDALTDLPNRALLTDRMNQTLARARRNGTRAAVIYLDLDGFKQINDTLGHDVGDKTLQSVAARLKGCIRSSDTVSRQGGDEFVVLLSEVSHPEDASVMARKILTALTSSHALGDTNIHITLSMGLSTYPEDGQDPETLLKNADTAMYQAKKTGRNNYQFYTKQMNARAIERQGVEADLGFALERNQFVLHYQPKINLETGRITGVEALIRWAHPERGLVCPGEFIPIAEECGLIMPIDRWVLREACRQVKSWEESGLRIVPVSVNVSSLEFRSADFIQGLSTILNDTRLMPKYLELELTESVLMRRVESTTSMLDGLNAIGVRLAIDDFGTGYSSLSYLKRFPIDILKIDQSFVRDISIDPDDAAIVTAVITMAKSLRKSVVAEGVETEEQLSFLRAHGCEEAQGYYFSRPLGPEQFADLLKVGIKPSLIPPDPSHVPVPPSTTMRGRVEQIIASSGFNKPERAKILIEPTYNQTGNLRIGNALSDERSDDVKLKKGAHVEITVTAEPEK
jgi:diguanylate cyclase (GGDEF)-like protein/PAS domain S-box-containing protein